MRGKKRKPFIIQFYRSIRMMLVRWRQDAVSSEPPASPSETGSKPMKIYYERALDGGLEPLRNSEAPECLEDAVQLAKASAIIGQIGTDDLDEVVGLIPCRDGIGAIVLTRGDLLRIDAS
jgi:hypothetical protein